MTRSKPNAGLLEAYERDAKLQGLSDLTLKAYKHGIETFLGYLGTNPVAKVTIKDLAEYLGNQKDQKLDPRTLSGRISALSSFFEFLEFEGKIKGNPVPGFRRRYLGTLRRELGKKKSDRKLVAVEQLRAMLQTVVDARDRCIIGLLAKTGMRRDELVQLDVRSIDLTKQTVDIKPHPKRTNCQVFFDDETGRVLRRWLAVRRARTGTDAGPLFVGQRGNRINGDAVNDAVSAAARNVGLHDPEGPLKDRFTAHNLRHFFTTHLRRGGMTREHIAWLRGDAGNDSMDVYMHIDPDQVQQAYRSAIPQLGL
ncbi:MAG: tyrosine-type recombinase/integrase [bacterium]